MMASLQLPILSNIVSYDIIQYPKNSLDDQIERIVETMDKMTHELEKIHMPNFSSHRLGNEIVASNTLTTNKLSQS
jgi:hypothetical protein